MKARIFFTAVIVAASFGALKVYQNFVIQEQGDMVIGQVNGGDLEYGVARIASRDYSNIFMIVMVLGVLALWATVAWRAIRDRDGLQT